MAVCFLGLAVSFGAASGAGAAVAVSGGVLSASVLTGSAVVSGVVSTLASGVLASGTASPSGRVKDVSEVSDLNRSAVSTDAASS